MSTDKQDQLRQEIEKVLVAGTGWDYHGQWGPEKIDQLLALIEREKKAAVEEAVQRLLDLSPSSVFIADLITPANQVLSEMFPPQP